MGIIISVVGNISSMETDSTTPKNTEINRSNLVALDYSVTKDPNDPHDWNHRTEPLNENPTLFPDHSSFNQTIHTTEGPYNPHNLKNSTDSLKENQNHFSDDEIYNKNVGANDPIIQGTMEQSKNFHGSDYSLNSVG